MSRYLIRRIEDNPAIVLHAGRSSLVWRETAISNACAGELTSDSRLKPTTSDTFSSWPARCPTPAGSSGCVVLDEKRFIKTGPDLSPADLTAAAWPLARPPYLLETSRPGIFAVGDVRGGNIKRVASAVGEGSIAIAFVHQVLQQRREPRSHRLTMHEDKRMVYTQQDKEQPDMKTLDADEIITRATPLAHQHAHEIQPYRHLVRMPSRSLGNGSPDRSRT